MGFFKKKADGADKDNKSNKQDSKKGDSRANTPNKVSEKKKEESQQESHSEKKFEINEEIEKEEQGLPTAKSLKIDIKSHGLNVQTGVDQNNRIQSSSRIMQENVDQSEISSIDGRMSPDKSSQVSP